MSFVQLLTESGCRLDSSTVVFAVEPVLFRRQLGIKLRSQSDLFEQFIQNLQEYTEDTTVFRKCLLPSTLDDKVPKTSRTSSSESLFKTLLAIDSLQSDLITYLLERLPEFYDELENDNSSSCTARLILHQLRWLDYIAQPEVLTGKLIEIIQITPAIIQHELITSLPDIINDSEHKPIVVFLKELMNENSELTVPILDALSNLTLHSESLEDVRESVLDRLESAELDDLAIIVKFMLQTVTPNSIDLVIYGIRQKLDFRSLGKLQQQQQQQQSRKNTPVALILESIKLGLQFHKFVCDSWLRSIVALESQREHKVIDVLVLIILYSMTSMKKKAESILRKKIVNGQITAALVQETIMCHSDGLSGYWNTILSLSESLLRLCQQYNVISPCASTLYISTFKSTDAYYKQEVIGALVTHIGSGVEAEMNVALNVLLKLVKSNVNSVIAYSVFIKGILDYLDNLNVSQIRILFDIFSLLALTTGNTADGSANLWSEIQTIIRKQLSNPREKYKNIGIIASLSSVKVLGSKHLCDASENQAAGGSSTQSHRTQLNDAVRHPLLRQATGLLELALRNSREYPNCVALIYDELAHMFTEEKIDERLQLWVKENMASDFTEFYVEAISEALERIEEAKKQQYAKLLPGRHMSLDGENDQIALKIYDLIYTPDTKKKKYLMTPMCSIFNLIQSCEKQLNEGSLEEIDALFGCSVIMFEAEHMEDLETEELEYACDMLFYTINWFKELLNAFMFSKEENYQTRLVTRLRHVLQLETVLDEMMVQNRGYTPLEFHNTVPVSFDTDNRNTQIISNTAANTESQDDNSTQATAAISNKTSAKKENKTTVVKFASVNDIRPFTRAFHVHVLELLKYNEEIQEGDDKMTYQEINYVLADLDQKLDIKIAPSQPTSVGKKRLAVEEKHPSCNSSMLARIDPPSFMKKVIVYLPHILQTLENIYAEMQSKDIEPGRIEGNEDIAKSIFYIFNILHKMLLWPDIQNSDNKAILEDIIHAIAERISGESKQKRRSPPEVELEQAFQYLSNFGDSIPQSTTAVVLFKTLQRLMLISDQNSAQLKSNALRVVQQINSTNWFDWRDIKKEVAFLFEQSIELSENPLEVLHDLVNNVLPRFDEEGNLEEYPLLKNDTVVQHYQAIINQTVKALDLLKDTDQETEVVLVQNARIVKIFERITSYIKTKQTKVLMGVLLRTGRAFIEQFTKHSIPYFTRVFKTHSNSVIAIFKDFQASTRMLQIICSHVKVLKEVALATYVPPLKKSLEIVIYQVKMLLTENRIPPSAFFMGALKHRDIRGAEISSQIPREMSSEDEDEETAEDQDADPEETAADPEETAADPEETAADPEEEEETNSTSESAVSKKNKSTTDTSKRKNALQRSKEETSAIRREVSVIVSSSEEAEDADDADDADEEMDDDALPVLLPTKKREFEKVDSDQDEEEEDEVLEIDLDKEEDEDEEEDEEDIPSIPVPSKSPAKKRRLGLGRPTTSSDKKVFNLTNRSDEESE